MLPSISLAFVSLTPQAAFSVHPELSLAWGHPPPIFLKDLESRKWCRCIFRGSEGRIWKLTKYSSRLWCFSWWCVRGWTPQGNRVVDGPRLHRMLVLFLTAFFFSKIYSATTWHLYLCMNCSSYVNGSIAHWIHSSCRFFLIIQCLSDWL